MTETEGRTDKEIWTRLLVASNCALQFTGVSCGVEPWSYKCISKPAKGTRSHLNRHSRNGIRFEVPLFQLDLDDSVYLVGRAKHSCMDRHWR